ncbi:Uncharacterized oxidoreductase SSP0419 [Durusdinium trenchii]|uniref:Uncharacterized oxidoreductase SSP0419 n=1 Tax=Durusdinium trenchii TaxID=1381693 RepID=A0ABP0SKW7_9DINO
MTQPTRREFLQTASLATAAACLPALGPSAQAGEKRTGANRGRIYKSNKGGAIGADKAGMLETLETYKTLGFDGIEGGSTSIKDPAALLEAMAEVDFPVHGLVGGVHWQQRLSSPDPAARQIGLESLIAALHLAHQLRGSTVLLVPGKVTGADENHDHVWERSIVEIRKALPTASRLGVRILIENVWNGFCEEPDQFRDYIDEIDSPWVGAYFDIGNVRKFGKPEDWIRTLGSRIVKLDVKDWGKENGFCRLGEGDVDWPAVREALAEIEFTGWATREGRVLTACPLRDTGECFIPCLQFTIELGIANPVQPEAVDQRERFETVSRYLRAHLFDLPEFLEAGMNQRPDQLGTSSLGNVIETAVLLDEPADAVCFIVRESQSLTDLRDRAADGSLPTVLPVCGGQVMEQGGECRRERRGPERGEDLDTLCPRFFVLVGVCFHFGQDHFEQPQLSHQFARAPSLGMDEHLAEFLCDSFGTHHHDLRDHLFDRVKGLTIEMKVEHSRESHGPEHPQFVFAHPRTWVADGADNALFEIVLTADEVVDRVGKWIEEHPVDREIASLGILLRRTKGDMRWPPSIAVVSLPAERCDLDVLQRLGGSDENHPEAFTHSDCAALAEDLPDLVGAGIGGDVEVVRDPVHQQIAHAATGKVRGVPGGDESLDHVDSEVAGCLRLLGHVERKSFRDRVVTEKRAAFARLTPDRRAKTVLISGGGTGIGAGCAAAFAAAGYRVAIAGRRLEKLQEAAASIKSSEPILVHTVDVADRESVRELIDWATKELGQIDVLLNSAGTNVAKRSMADLDPADWDLLMQVNATGAYNCMHAVLPQMRERKDGLIINISSIAGLRSSTLGGVAYNASKFAMTALGTCVGVEERENGIRVTNVYPGEVETPILDARPVPVSAEHRARILQPSDIASMVVAVAQLPPRAHVPDLVIKPRLQEWV